MNRALHTTLSAQVTPISTALNLWFDGKRVANAELICRLMDFRDSGSSARSTVVVVDDEPTVSVTLAEIIARQNLDVVWFTSSLEALDFLRKTKVDLLLSDINMPHMDGITLSECVHMLQPSCFLFLISAAAEDCSVLNRIERSGLPIYLEAKPLHPRRLVQAIRTMLCYDKMLND